MDRDEETTALVERAAKRAGLPPATLKALLDLEDQFPDFTIPGERTRFARLVADVLDAAVETPDDRKA